MEKRTFTVQHFKVELSQPYEAGHTISEIEAAVLNTARGEGIGEKLRPYFKKLQNEDNSYNPEHVKTMLAEVEKHDAEFEFTLANTGSKVYETPEEVEARKLARAYVNSKIADTGVTIKAYKAANGDEKYNSLIEQTSKHPSFVKLAIKTIKEREKTMESFDAMDDSALDLEAAE